MSDDYEFDQRTEPDDDEPIAALCAVNPAQSRRTAWRFDLEAAPVDKPVYAREPESVRVMIAIREQQGWVALAKDGVCHALAAVGSWAAIADDGA